MDVVGLRVPQLSTLLMARESADIMIRQKVRGPFSHDGSC